MKSIIHLCKLCNAQYESEQKAKDCEKHHKKVSKIEQIKYIKKESDPRGYPVNLWVKMEDGVVVIYRR